MWPLCSLRNGRKGWGHTSSVSKPGPGGPELEAGPAREGSGKAEQKTRERQVHNGCGVRSIPTVSSTSGFTTPGARDGHRRPPHLPQLQSSFSAEPPCPQYSHCDGTQQSWRRAGGCQEGWWPWEAGDRAEITEGGRDSLCRCWPRHRAADQGGQAGPAGWGRKPLGWDQQEHQEQKQTGQEVIWGQSGMTLFGISKEKYSGLHNCSYSSVSHPCS